MKTATQIRKEQKRKAENLPIETKRKFWALMREGKTLGEAAQETQLDTMVAAQLTLMLFNHYEFYIPKKIEEIK